MPIRPPRLDDRSYADLVEELLARIPAHAPEYTDARTGDPGRTLIELFAWLTDTVLYRVNFIPERQRLQFLSMVGLPLRPASPASGLVSLRYKDLDGQNAAVESLTLREGAVVRGPVDFETLRPVTVHPVSGAVWHKRKLSAAEARSSATLLSELATLYELGKAKPKGYVTTPTFPTDQGIDAGVDLASASVDGALWISLLAGRPDKVTDARAALGRSNDGLRQVISIGVVPALEAAPKKDLSLGAGTARRLPVVWEITGASPGPRFIPLEVLRDGTDGLTRTGVIELLLPSVEHIGLPHNDVRKDTDAGVGTRPPRIDDDKIAARLVTWLRLRAASKVDHLRLSWVGVHAAEIDQRRTLTDVALGVSDGRADQRLALPLGAVDRDSFRLEVEAEGAGWQPWRLVEHLGLAGGAEQVYTLDDEEGAVLFGDGLRGAVPDLGRRVRATFLRAGGGEAGNLPAGSLKSISARRAADGGAVTRPLECGQPVATIGGCAAETLEEAERRIPAMLRHRDRAITAEDFKDVASDTPAVQLGRVEVIPGFKPQQLRKGVPGVVSVMVLPRNDGLMPPNPRPARHTIEAVHEHTSARVTLGTELYVIGCQYLPISVAVSFELREGFGREDTLAEVRTAVRRFLWPLSPGGPTEEGWPLRRPVRARELSVVVARVPGVDEVLGVNLFTTKDDQRWSLVKPGADGTAEIAILDWQLPELMNLIVLTDGKPPSSLDDSTSGGDEIAVPVVPEVC